MRDLGVFRGVGRIGGEIIELIKIQQQQATILHGNVIKAKEVPGGNSRWGGEAWTFPPDKLDDALAIMRRLSGTSQQSSGLTAPKSKGTLSL